VVSIFATSVLVAVLGVAPGDEEPAEAARLERLEFLKDKAAQFSLSRESSPDQPLKLKESPIHRFSNPERDGGSWDGATFLWLDGARPMAAICFSIRRPNDAVFREHSSFSNTPLVCEKSGKVSWAPRTGGLIDYPLHDSPPPAATEPARLTQMRTVARRLSATCYYKEEATQLRLMPQPLYRYRDKEHGVLDGALFSMAVSNDAELLLLMEILEQPAAGALPWRVSLARMSSLRLVVRLDDAEIWTVPGYYTIPPAERKAGPYIEAFEGNFKSRAERAK
jgi:hypothetical protein